jgi:hypothetical protein
MCVCVCLSEIQEQIDSMLNDPSSRRIEPNFNLMLTINDQTCAPPSGSRKSHSIDVDMLIRLTYREGSIKKQ